MKDEGKKGEDIMMMSQLMSFDDVIEFNHGSNGIREQIDSFFLKKLFKKKNRGAPELLQDFFLKSRS